VTGKETDRPVSSIGAWTFAIHIGMIRHQFDVVLMCEIIEHLDDPAPVVREGMNLLKDGGLFIASCPYGDQIPDPEHVTEWDHESLFRLLAPYGSAITFRALSPTVLPCGGCWRT
jgi:2-polyprenyl-3-methyl-5-hydroxy-6-metoxy-1,4-benzoquinol methylase